MESLSKKSKEPIWGNTIMSAVLATYIVILNKESKMDENHDRNFKATEYLDRKADEAREGRILNILLLTAFFVAFFACGFLLR